MAPASVVTLALGALALLTACETTVVGGGGVGGGDGSGGAATGGPATTSGANPTTTSSTADAGSTAVATSTASGDIPRDVQGVLVARDADEVDFLLGNSPQSCDAVETEPPCAPGDWWVATINIPRNLLTPGTYPLNTGEIGINVWETFDDCSGYGGRGWDAEPAWLTIDTIDADHAVITIEGAYDDVDGTWDVPLCGDVTPA